MSNQARRRYSFGPFQLDLGAQLLLREGQAIPLKPKVFDLLVVLVENGGRVVGKEELMKRLWPESFVEDGNLAVSICELRKTLGDGRGGEAYISTVPRRGYRFAASLVDESDGAAEVIASYSSKGASGGGSIEGTIAVLPFKSIGSTGEEYLGLALADALITRLSNLRQIIVRPTSSMRKYDGSQDPIAAGRELGVEWVLDGSVQRSGERMRATVQLVKVDDGASKWAGKFDERFSDIFGVEDSISEQVVNALTLKLTGEERTLLAKRYTENTEAHLAYLKGRYFFNKRTPADLKKAITQFELAIEADPDYALAYSGLADSYNIFQDYGQLPPRECFRKAREAALHALRLDDGLAEAHTSLAHLNLMSWDWASAEREFRKAIRLNPNYAAAHQWYSGFLRAMGRFDEAMLEIKRAQEIDPLSLTVNSSMGALFYLSGRFNEAIDQLRRTLELEPEFATAHFYLGLVFLAKGMYREAESAYEQTKALWGEDPEMRSFFGRVCALTGRTGDAVEVITELSQTQVESGAHCFLVAGIYAALGNTDRAIEWLERAYAEHDVDLAMLKVEPMMDSLRHDPRVVSLLERMRLVGPLNRQTFEVTS